LKGFASNEIAITNLCCPECEYRLVEHESKLECLNCGHSIDSDFLISALSDY
jgi:exosome complex RNA-binding protein Csl4